MFEWAYSGANKAVPRNVGPECAYFLSPQRQLIETLIVITVCVYVIVSIVILDIKFILKSLISLLVYM